MRRNNNKPFHIHADQQHQASVRQMAMKAVHLPKVAGTLLSTGRLFQTVNAAYMTDERICNTPSYCIVLLNTPFTAAGYNTRFVLYSSENIAGVSADSEKYCPDLLLSRCYLLYTLQCCRECNASVYCMTYFRRQSHHCVWSGITGHNLTPEKRDNAQFSTCSELVPFRPTFYLLLTYIQTSSVDAM